MPKPPDDALASALGNDWAELAQARFEPVISGLSGASVYRVTESGLPQRYLKIAEQDAAAALSDEIARTRWLAARGATVPEIIRVEERGNRVVLLTQALAGTPADENPLPAPVLINALAAAFATLHALPVSQCPFDESVAVRLARATTAVNAGDIDPSHFDTRNSAVSAEALLARLVKTRPAEDLVVVHGDASLNNVIVDKNGGIGFVDCGNAGRGDRYLDLAVLASGIEEHYGCAAFIRFAKAYSRTAWDSAKAEYFLDLYELF